MERNQDLTLAPGLVIAAAFAGFAPAVRAVDTTGWCGTVTDSPVIMCDDFDDYCPDPPCDDAIGDDTPDQNLFLQTWVSDGCVDADLIDPSVASVQGDDTCGEGGIERCAASPPLASRQTEGANWPNAANENYMFDGTSHRLDLLPRIQELDITKGSVNGTNENPLVLQFVLDLPGDATKRFDAAQTNRYVELTDGSDRAGADYSIWTCSDGKQRPHVAMDNDKDHDAIAVGMFAVLDDDPCSPEARPLTYRLSLYDGDRWRELRPTIFGSTNDGLKVGGHLNFVTVTIKSTTIEIHLESTVSGAAYVADAAGPRTYTGPFSAMHIGNGLCLASAQNEYVDNVALTGGVLEPPIATGACCLADASCVDATTEAGCTNRLDGSYNGNGSDCANIVCATPPGACCLPDATCVQIPAEDCDAQNGAFNGAFTLCENTSCCPRPFADHDTDGDVDLLDFAALQRCITTPPLTIAAGCECFDKNGDEDIDLDDVEEFVKCGTGPNRPFDFENPPAACLP